MIVIDTDLLIDHLRKVPEANRLVERAVATGELVATTVVNAAELLRGADPDRRPMEEVKAARDLIDALEVLELDMAAARRFGRFMARLDTEGDPIPSMDALVAAVALEHGATLATRNVRDYGRVEGLNLVQP